MPRRNCIFEIMRAQQGGELGDLLWQPRNAAAGSIVASLSSLLRSPLVWIVSFSVWTMVALVGAFTITEFYRSMHSPLSFFESLGMQLSQILTYAPLTPIVFALAVRYPIGRENWLPRSLVYLGGGVLFSVAHIVLRGLTPYAFWDSKSHMWFSGIWDPQAHAFRVQWQIFEDLLFRNLVDDITGTYVPIVLAAHMLSYYRRSSERERRNSLLEAQLTNAKMQALKAQLQPHFLFNTLHSISSLMLSDVNAADKMMTRLSELLRMSLQNEGGQVTTLNREIEFVAVYLEIEKMKFGQRLRVTLDIADDTLDAQVPHLLLQPLVENAVRHGIAHLTSVPGEIHISSRQADGLLKLTITDNGPGLGEQHNARGGGGLGLRATRERLQTLYGNDQTFSLISAPRAGTEVLIKIPFSTVYVPA
ncbi:MAG: histidine kinase [Acidobacteria bacterium]|nr:histidine kinase [Acidobacteriota bacterium]MBV9479338.1 histidine kinase [Acidobacteriota bacterium]